MNTRAFTLIETLIAIAIVTIAVSGPLLTASRTLVAAYTARDQLTASYLASEAVEYIRFMRDSMYLADFQAYSASDGNLSKDAFCDFTNLTPNDPNAGCAEQPAQPGASIAACIGAGDGNTLCTLADPLALMGFPPNDQSLAQCTGGSCPPLYLNSGRYTTAPGGTPTSFVRTIRFYGWGSGGNAQYIGSELEVLVTVSWQERGITYSTSQTDYLSPWQ